MDQEVARDQLARADDDTKPLDPHCRLLLEAKSSLERARESDREFRRLVSRRTKKLEYRRVRETAGAVARENRDLSKLPRDTGETEEDFHRRIRREAARERRGVNAQTVRRYTKLSTLSDHERQEHRAERARDRKRKERERKRQNKSATQPPVE